MCIVYTVQFRAGNGLSFLGLKKISKAQTVGFIFLEKFYTDLIKFIHDTMCTVQGWKMALKKPKFFRFKKIKNLKSPKCRFFGKILYRSNLIYTDLISYFNRYL